LQTAFNDIVAKYAALPAKLKTDGVAERVKFQFSETDIGRTDLKDSKSLCKFAGKLVSQLKKAEGNNKKRLAAARELLCIKGGALLKKVVDANNCLRKAKRDAGKGDASVKKDADDSIAKFDGNALKKVKKFVGLMKKKCLMKETAKSKAAPVKGLFREKLKARIKKNKGDLTEEDKQKIAEAANAAVQKKYPEATNIKTTITDATRRQLRPRRSLASSADVETTWDVDEPANAADKVAVVLSTDFTVGATEISAAPTTSTIAVAEPVTPIDNNLPDGSEPATTKPATAKPEKKPTAKPKEPEPAPEVEEASTGAKVAFGSAICAALLFV